MSAVQQFLIRLFRETDGQDLVEYSLVIALMAFGAVAGMHSLSTGISDSFSTISSDLSTSL
jgi:pilus assembly protein Flp/PilA